MDDFSLSQRRYNVLNLIFGALVVLVVFYIIWRGFAAESAQEPTPLFGEVSSLEWQGQKHSFKLVSFADFNTVHSGALVVQEKEVPAAVWQVTARDTRQVHLTRRHAGRIETRAITLPPTTDAAHFILLKPAPASAP